MRKLKKLLSLRLVPPGDAKRQTNGTPFGVLEEIDQPGRYA